MELTNRRDCTLPTFIAFAVGKVHQRQIMRLCMLNSLSFLCLSLYGSAVPLLDLARFFSFLILYTVGRTPWTGNQPVARPLSTRRSTQTQDKLTQTPHCLEWDSNPRLQCSSGRRQFSLITRGHCDRLCMLVISRNVSKLDTNCIMNSFLRCLCSSV
jgi:hypothetical protein